MDEPFTGLDPVNVRLLKEAFLEMRDRGKTLIFSTHQMETVEELCESIAIVDRGRVVVSGAGPGREARHGPPGGAARDRRRRPRRRVARASCPASSVTAQREDYVELHVPADRDPETILRAAIERGDRVTRFEIAEPSLEEIFVEHVGRRAVDEAEEHLAATGRGGGRDERPVPERAPRRPARVPGPRARPRLPHHDRSCWPSRSWP